MLHLPVAPNVELVAAKAVETIGKNIGMHQTHVEAASVAVVEACLNAMEHGGGTMTVRLRSELEQQRPRLVVEVEDHGEGFDPAVCQSGCASSGPLKRKDKRGWGLTLIRELMDEVQIQSQPGFTQVRMFKYVESAP